jgi:hypothetical protein
MPQDLKPPWKVETSQSFPLSRLPPELRHIIWNFTLPERQVHKAIVRSCFDSNIRTKATHILSPPLPAALWTCRESRASARLIQTRFPRCQCDPSTTAFGYFNPKSDILYIDTANPSDDWYAPWVDFTNFCMVVLHNCESTFETRINPAVSKILSCRPNVTLYLMYLYFD